MYAENLIGKKAIRVARTKDTGDRSYTDHPLIIKRANSYRIVFEYGDDWHRKYMDKNEHILGSDFCDDNWVEFK